MIGYSAGSGNRICGAECRCRGQHNQSVAGSERVEPGNSTRFENYFL